MYVITSLHSHTKKELYFQIATHEKLAQCFKAKAQRQEIWDECVLCYYNYYPELGIFM